MGWSGEGSCSRQQDQHLQRDRSEGTWFIQETKSGSLWLEWGMAKDEDREERWVRSCTDLGNLEFILQAQAVISFIFYNAQSVWDGLEGHSRGCTTIHIIIITTVTSYLGRSATRGTEARIQWHEYAWEEKCATVWTLMLEFGQ